MQRLKFEEKRPLRHCIDLVKEVDSMLNELHKENDLQKHKPNLNIMPLDFVNAVDYLALRVKSCKNIKPSKYSRPVLTVSEKLGPGSYFIERSMTPVFENSTRFRVQSKKDKRKCKSPDFIEKNRTLAKNLNFAAEHNLKVQQLVEHKISEQKKVLNKKRIRFLDKFNYKVHIEIERAKLEISKEASIFLGVLGYAYYLNTITIIKKKIRARSRHLLRWLSIVLRVIGKFIVRAQKIRKVIANRNIVGISRPFFKFSYSMRMKHFKSVLKVVKNILQLNLIMLLMYRWKKYINLIQFSFRNYKLVKKCRTAAFNILCNKYSKNSSWNNFTNNQKTALIEKFIQEKLLEYAKAACKYYYEINILKTGAARNIAIMGGGILSGFMGRGLKVFDLKKPNFHIFIYKNEIIKEADSYQVVLNKSISNKRLKKKRR